MDLNRTQRKHYLSIKWLLIDGDLKTASKKEKNRQTGRSTLMQLIFVELAMSRPGQPIWWFDHIPGSSMRWAAYENFKRRVKKLQEEGLKGRFKVTKKSITYWKS